MSAKSSLISRNLLLLSIVFILTFAPGCAMLKNRFQSQPWDIAEAEAVLDELRELKGVDSLRAEGKLKVHSLSRLIPLNQTFLARAPEALRLEAYGPMGQVAFIACLFGGEFKVVSIAENTFYYGPAVPETLERFFTWKFEPSDLTGFFMGRMPIQPGRVVKARQHKRTGQLTILCETDEGFIQEVVTDSTCTRPLSMEIFSPDGKPLLRASFDNFITTEGVEFPLERRIEVEDGKKGFTLVFSSVEINPTLSDRMFRLRHPAGMKRINLKEGNL